MHLSRLVLGFSLLAAAACAPTAPRDGTGLPHADSLEAEREGEAAPYTGRGALDIVQIYGPLHPEPGQAVSYRARLQPGFAAPVVYEWDFGDGTLSLGNNVMHTFRHAGRYTITVAARNAYNADSSKLVVHVGAPQAAPDPLPDVPAWTEAVPVDDPVLYWVVGFRRTEPAALAAADTLAAAGLQTTLLMLPRAPRRYLLLSGGYASAREAQRARPRVERLAGGPAWLMRLNASVLTEQ